MPRDLRSPLAKMRDDWFDSEEGLRLCDGSKIGVSQKNEQYLRNRLEIAFLAGAKAAKENERRSCMFTIAARGARTRPENSSGRTGNSSTTSVRPRECQSLTILVLAII